MATAWSQNIFRIRHDDGDQLSASWFGANNANIFIQAGHNFRIRFDITETGTTAATLTGQLQCNRNGGAFQAVTASSTIAMAIASPNTTFNNQATTQQLGVETFVAGNCDAADGLCSATGSIATNSGTELEFCVQLVQRTTAADDAIQFRVVVSPSTAFAAYVNTPTITVVPPNRFQNYMFVDSGGQAGIISVTEKIR